uniref:Uncharacterized protein n=1 Tax=Anopheles minimus TaxID=112268 RepID=A0A182WPG3_9DIPT
MYPCSLGVMLTYEPKVQFMCVDVYRAYMQWQGNVSKNGFLRTIKQFAQHSITALLPVQLNMLTKVQKQHLLPTCLMLPTQMFQTLRREQMTVING